MLLRLLLILYFDKSSLQLAYRLKVLSQVVVSPFSICLQATSMLMFFCPALCVEFCFRQETRTPNVIRMICKMLSLVLLSYFLLRTRRGMFVVKSGRSAFLNRGSSGGGVAGDAISCGGVPGLFYLTQGALEAKRLAWFSQRERNIPGNRL